MAADVSDLRSQLTDLIESAGFSAAQSLYDDLDVPVVTGQLEASGHIDDLGGSETRHEWAITFDAPQGLWTDEGTDPHVIVGNPNLAFVMEGQLVIVRSVQHPGQQGTSWFTTGTDSEHWEEACQAAVAADGG